MPNLIVLVDPQTGNAFPRDGDYKALDSNEIVFDEESVFANAGLYPSSAYQYGLFQKRAGLFFNELNGTPLKGSTETYQYRTLPVVHGATDCAVSEGFLGAANIKPLSIRFFVNMAREFRVSATSNALIHPVLDDVNLSYAAKRETKRVMVVDVKDDYRYPTGELGTLVSMWGIYAFEVGYVNYITGTIYLAAAREVYPSSELLISSRIEDGPDFLCTVRTNSGDQTRIIPWDAFVRSSLKTPSTGVFVTTMNFILDTVVSDVRFALFNTQPSVQKTLDVRFDSLGFSVVPPKNGSLSGVTFKIGDVLYTGQEDGTVTTNTNPATGQGTVAGSVNASTGDVSLTQWAAGASGIADFHAASAPAAAVKATCNKITIRTASAPLRPGSFSVSWKSPDPSGGDAGVQHSATADLDGYINTPDVIGIVDYAHGIVRLWFVTDYVRTTGGDIAPSDFSNLGIAGVTNRKVWMAYTTTLKYNAVSYSYLPLDANLLGVDPVRLPSDGRVPIFRPGGFVVIGHTGEIEATVSNGQTVNCARERLSRVRLVGHDGTVINTGYSTNLNAGTVTFSDVSGYSQPVKIQHRIEDMMMASDVQINGQITFTRALTHDYPLGSYISSALVVNDLRARVSVVFDQASWNGSTWADAVTGSAAVATFNDAQFPITVTNRGALTERWVVQFTNTTAFNVIGENVGVIAAGNVNTNCAPINPATGVPYFTIPAGGWGQGWSAGNVLRFNTIGAIFPVWCVRTVQQGPETVTNDNFTILVRGDINTP